MLCCVPRQHPPLDNASVSGIAGPREPGTASTNTAIDGARLQPGCRCWPRCYITPGTRAPRKIRKFPREPQPQWSGGQAAGPGSAIFAARTPSLNFTPDWSRRLPKIYLIVGSGGQDVRQPGMAIAPALGRSPMDPQKVLLHANRPGTFPVGVAAPGPEKDIDNQSAATGRPRVATDTGKKSLNDDRELLERGRAEPSAAVDSPPPFSRPTATPEAS
jgi:hypothetical protein